MTATGNFFYISLELLETQDTNRNKVYYVVSNYM